MKLSLNCACLAFDSSGLWAVVPPSVRTSAVHALVRHARIHGSVSANNTCSLQCRLRLLRSFFLVRREMYEESHGHGFPADYFALVSILRPNLQSLGLTALSLPSSLATQGVCLHEFVLTARPYRATSVKSDNSVSSVRYCVLWNKSVLSNSRQLNSAS